MQRGLHCQRVGQSTRALRRYAILLAEYRLAKDTHLGEPGGCPSVLPYAGRKDALAVIYLDKASKIDGCACFEFKAFAASLIFQPHTPIAGMRHVPI
jgi:hypothetical protein